MVVKVMKSKDDKSPSIEEVDCEAAATRDQFRQGRRRALKAGAVLVPTIVTLHATPAWAQTDYTMVAYRYGTHAGLCRNAHFNPRANPNSHAGQEFIECNKGGKEHVVFQEEFEAPSDSELQDIDF